MTEALKGLQSPFARCIELQRVPQIQGPRSASTETGAKDPTVSRGKSQWRADLKFAVGSLVFPWEQSPRIKIQMNPEILL